MSDEGDLFDPPAKLTDDMLVSAHISHFREVAGISQTELARRMSERGFKWTQSTVYKVESGNRNLGFAEGVALAQVLGVQADDLLDRGVRTRLMVELYTDFGRATARAQKLRADVDFLKRRIDENRGSLTAEDFATLKKQLGKLRAELRRAAEA